QDHGPTRAKAVPEKGLSIERIPGTVHKWGPQCHDRQPGALVNTEQRALTHRLITRVRTRMVVWREGVAFVMVQAIAIGRNARHENITATRTVEQPRHRFNLGAGCAALPIVGEV